MHKQKHFSSHRPTKSIINKVILVFGLLAGVIIANAVYSTIQSTRSAEQSLIGQLQRKTDTAAAVLENELDKVKIISNLFREKNRIIIDFLDYDKIAPIKIMLQTLASKHGIDIVLLFDENQELLTTNSFSKNYFDKTAYHGDIENTDEHVDLATMPTSILAVKYSLSRWLILNNDTPHG